MGREVGGQGAELGDVRGPVDHTTQTRISRFSRPISSVVSGPGLCVLAQILHFTIFLSQASPPTPAQRFPSEIANLLCLSPNPMGPVPLFPPHSLALSPSPP